MLIVVLLGAIGVVGYQKVSPTPLYDQSKSPTTDASSFIAETISGRASIIDGDTIEIHGVRIRLYGIDAPEGGQYCYVDGNPTRCGQRAALALTDKIASHIVSCEAKDRDRYGRVVAVCTAGGEDLNAWMVEEGWAFAYRRYSIDYVPQEQRAKASKRGIWRLKFIYPWDWRRDNQNNRTDNKPSNSASSNSASGQCLIKGNISQKGERIYHMPGGAFYDQTVISIVKGERWFCSEGEAQAAGWRRSRR
jgi:endonuclease YncB( thermonuclease family)